MRLQTSLPLAKVAVILDEALRLGRKKALPPRTVAAPDAGGRLLARKSEGGSGALRFDIVFGKAWGRWAWASPAG